jgi:hypothetical protein
MKTTDWRVVILFCCMLYFPPAPIAAQLPSEPEDPLAQRLRQLEPPEPSSLQALPGEPELERHGPRSALPLPDVIRSGASSIPFRVIHDDPDYRRPVYEEHWHSTYWGGRWSYMPSRVHHALHRLFATYDIGLSGELEFKSNVGVQFPMFQNETDLDLYLVVFQTAIQNVYSIGNQIVVVGKPRRTGVEVITVKTRPIRPSERDRLLLIQLATSTGDELDYALIPYMEPDFWFKQKKKGQNQTP